MKEIKKLEALLYRTENNIEFYLSEDRYYSLLNEIGVMRGILYAIEEITGSQRKLSKKELSYIELQQTLKSIDNPLEVTK